VAVTDRRVRLRLLSDLFLRYAGGTLAQARERQLAGPGVPLVLCAQEAAIAPSATRLFKLAIGSAPKRWHAAALGVGRSRERGCRRALAMGLQCRGMSDE
jgi:hypothetical protein